MTGCSVPGTVDFLFAILTVIRNSIGNMIQIVDRLLELTKTVAGDIRAMGAGEPR